MSSLRQIEANRLNALKSTGPISEAGKAASSMNAFKTGLHAKSLVLPSEKVADLKQLIDEYYGTHSPKTPEARALLDDVILTEWEIRRLHAAENQAWQHIVYDKYSPNKPEFPLGKALTCGGNTFSRVQHRINCTRRARDRALAAFRQFQSEPAPAPESLPAVAATPSPEATSPQIGFVPSSPSGTPPNPAPALSAPPRPAPICGTSTLSTAIGTRKGLHPNWSFVRK